MMEHERTAACNNYDLAEVPSYAMVLTNSVNRLSTHASLQFFNGTDQYPTRMDATAANISSLAL